MYMQITLLPLKTMYKYINTNNVTVHHEWTQIVT